jgi:hypothetical protein
MIIDQPQALKCHRWVNRVDYMMSTVAHLLDPSFRESGIYLKETMMRTKRGDYYSGAHGASDAAGSQAAGSGGSVSGGTGDPDPPRLLLDEAAYRSRIAAKIHSFEDAYWAQQERAAARSEKTVVRRRV